MTLVGIVPLAFVAFYSVNDTFAGESFIWVGTTFFSQIIASQEFRLALARSVGFSLLVLAIEIPLGVYIALRMPPKGVLTSVSIVLMTIPMLTPSIVVGFLWKALTLPKAGPLYEGLAALGFNLDMQNPVIVWLVLAAMDVWHWTSLVVLFCFAGLQAIPNEYYQAARIDGASRWSVFRYIQLPRLRSVLLVAGLLRLVDSFTIYTEPYVVTRGGPGMTTTFLSQELVLKSLVEFNLGEGGAMAVTYFFIVLSVSWVFFKISGSRAVDKTRMAHS
ncbi:MAG: sugar ABC transporter permease [Aestuariivirga sp.]